MHSDILGNLIKRIYEENFLKRRRPCIGWNVEGWPAFFYLCI